MPTHEVHRGISLEEASRRIEQYPLDVRVRSEEQRDQLARGGCPRVPLGPQGVGENEALSCFPGSEYRQRPLAEPQRETLQFHAFVPVAGYRVMQRAPDMLRGCITGYAAPANLFDRTCHPRSSFSPSIAGPHLCPPGAWLHRDLSGPTIISSSTSESRCSEVSEPRSFTAWRSPQKGHTKRF